MIVRAGKQMATHTQQRGWPGLCVWLAGCLKSAQGQCAAKSWLRSSLPPSQLAQGLVQHRDGKVDVGPGPAHGRLDAEDVARQACTRCSAAVQAEQYSKPLNKGCSRSWQRLQGPLLPSNAGFPGRAGAWPQQAPGARRSCGKGHGPWADALAGECPLTSLAQQQAQVLAALKHLSHLRSGGLLQAAHTAQHTQHTHNMPCSTGSRLGQRPLTRIRGQAPPQPGPLPAAPPTFLGLPFTRPSRQQHKTPKHHTPAPASHQQPPKLPWSACP